MRTFLRYILCLFVISLVIWPIITQRYQLEFPRQPGPEFDHQMRMTYATRLNREKPDIVLLGDSTLRDGVDPVRLSELTNQVVSRYAVPGSASAFWYLILKNNIIVTEHRPKVLLIVFRDTELTAPGYRVHGSYFVQLDEFAYHNEPLLLQRAYINLMNPLEYLAEKYFPLYAARVQIRDEMDAILRYSAPNWLGCNQECTDRSLENLLSSDNLEPGQLEDAIATADDYLYSPVQLNFKKQVDKSFLPEIIRLTKENNILLVLVRLKSQRTIADSSKQVFIQGYISDLADYLTHQKVMFLDYGNDPRLTSEDYGDSLHLNETGKVMFTQMLAEGLNKILR